MRELAEFAAVLATLVIFSIHVALPLDLDAASYAFFFFIATAPLAFLACVTEGLVLKRPVTAPWLFERVRDGYWLAVLPFLAVVGIAFAINQTGEVSSVVYNNNLINFISLLAGFATGFTAWEATEGRLLGKKLAWTDSFPEQGALEQVLYRVYAFLAGTALSVAAGVSALLLSPLFGFSVPSLIWETGIPASALFFAVMVFKVERLDAVAVTANGIGFYDALNDHLDEVVSFKSLKEIRMETSGDSFLAVALDSQGKRRVFRIYDAKGFEDVCGKKKARLFRK